MTSITKRKLGVVGLKVAEVGASVGVPAVAILQEFPIFKEPPTGKQLTAGGIMLLLVALLGLRRQLWPLLRDKLHVNSAGALIGWGLLFAAILWLESVTALLPSLRTVCISGLVGCGVGQVAHSAAGFVSGAKEKPDMKEAENA